MKIDDLFKKNKSEINQLLQLKLKINQETEWEILERTTTKATIYFSIVQLWRGKMIFRVFASRLYRGKPEYQEVIRRIEGNNYIGVRNMYSTMFGYNTVWSNSRPSYYVWNSAYRDVWLIQDKKYYEVWNCKLFDLQKIIELDPSLKYCAWTKRVPIIDYITIYRKYPEIEMLSKLNLTHLIYNVKILEALKDKHFKKFLFNLKSASSLSSTDILYCYKHKMSYEQIIDRRNEIKVRRNAATDVAYVLSCYPEIPKEKLIKYFIDKRITSSSVYLDLIRAEQFLHLDLSLEKNIFPHDFQYWHDFYTKQMQDIVNSDIDSRIEKQASNYKKLSKKVGGLELMLAKSTNDLIVEGEKLSHCVGRMGYNKKMANDESLILFVRKEDKLEEPYVTMEYDPHQKKVLQLYAEHDHQPDDYVKSLIYEKWLPRVKRLQFAATIRMKNKGGL